jgi:APA family basic amino acid/polyamine antiporter
MAELRKNLTLFDLTMIAVGSVIGSGIFLTPSSIAEALPSPFWILLVWVLGGVLALTGALTFSELNGMMPRAGGLYVYLSEGYGKVFGFLYGWIILWVVNTGGIAAVSIAFATYFGHFVPLDETGVKITAIAGLVLLTALNIRGVKSGAVFSDLFTVLKILGIAGLILIGLGWGGGGKTDYTAPLGELPGGLLSALAVAMVGVVWSCGGWQHATFAAGEAKNAKRTVSLAMIIGAAAVTVIYLLTNVAYLQVLSPAEIAASERVAADAAQAVLGPVGADLIALCIFISTFGTAGIYTLTAPRIYYAMAEDGVFFRRIAAVHPRFRTPLNAILLQSAWSIVLILFWGTFDNLISYVVFMDAAFFALAAAALFVFRRRSPEAERPYRTPGYPFVPLIFIAIMTGFVVNLVAERPVQSLAGLGFTLLGLPVYAFFFRKA